MVSICHKETMCTGFFIFWFFLNLLCSFQNLVKPSRMNLRAPSDSIQYLEGNCSRPIQHSRRNLRDPREASYCNLIGWTIFFWTRIGSRVGTVDGRLGRVNSKWAQDASTLACMRGKTTVFACMHASFDCALIHTCWKLIKPPFWLWFGSWSAWRWFIRKFNHRRRPLASLSNLITEF